MAYRKQILACLTCASSEAKLESWHARSPYLAQIENGLDILMRNVRSRHHVRTHSAMNGQGSTTMTLNHYWFDVSPIVDVSPVCGLAEAIPRFHLKMSPVMRKPAFCICENKDADQLRSNCTADQRLCFHYSDITIPLLHKSKMSSL